jgi:single-strand DNA-binding protein
LNKIVITGRLTRDPELKTAKTGTELCNFTVAVDRRMKDRGGEKQADFFDCTAWGKTGVFVHTYFRRGDGITLEGRMESEKWTDRDGNKRVSWKLQCDAVEFPVGGKKADSGEPYRRGADGGVDVPPPVTELGEGDDEGGDLPF